MGTAKWRKENAEHIRAYKRQWYEQNKTRVVGSVVERKRELTRWFNEYKAQLKCGQCGEDHPACLDFHHRDRSEKVVTVAWVANLGWSVAKMLTEIEKCDVLCSNCHRKLHWQERMDQKAASDVASEANVAPV